MTPHVLSLVLIQLLRSGICHPAMVDRGGIGYATVECPVSALQDKQMPYTIGRLPMATISRNPMKWGRRKQHRS